MALNRVALAAALLEYDNDNPASGLGYRKAQESAILIGAREAAAAVHGGPVSGARDSIVFPASVNGRNRQRHSAIIEDRGSTYGYIPGRGPADMEHGGAHDPEEMQEELDMAEVDLSSWGLPETLLPRQPLRISIHDNARASRQSIDMHTTRDQNIQEQDYGNSRASATYTQSPIANLTNDQSRPSPLDRIGSPFSASGQPAKPAVTSPENRKHRKGRTVSFHDYNSIVQSGMPNQEEGVEELRQHESPEPAVRPRSSMSMMNRGRPMSPFNAPLASPTSASGILAPMESASLPLRVPLPPSPGPAQADPYMFVSQSQNLPPGDEYAESNPFALPAPAGPRVSRFDPKISTPSLVPGIDAVSPGIRHMDRPASQASGYFPQDANRHHRPVHHRPAPEIRIRPRTLIMPMPLHGVLDPTQSQPSRWEQEGFTRGAKPLPPGALTRPDSFVGRLDGVANKPFTSSQQLFRVSLAGVDGKRDSHVSGYGYEAGLMDIPPSAERDGEVAVQQYGGRQGDDDDESEFEDEYLEPGDQDWRPETRYVRGPSLMDRLEARKAELKSKQRQFRGDSRPAMMSRSHTGPLVDLNAATDPATGQLSPRLGTKPLLNLQDEDDHPLERSVSHGDVAARPGIPRGKSVFGVDTVWEKELKKLEGQIESERALAAHMEEERKRKGLKKGKKAKGVPKGNREHIDIDARGPVHPHTETLLSQGRQDTSVPPSLSLGDLSAALNAPVNPSEGSITNGVPHKNVHLDDWAAGSDEEQGGEQPRRRTRRTIKPVTTGGAKGDSDSEDDEVPLAKAFGISRAKSPERDDSSEDEPLSNLRKKASSRTLDVSDEDDIPLALRRAKKMGGPSAPGTVGEVDEDDLPLAHRRLRAQQTGATDPGFQHQQQMAMAMAQQQQSMMFNPMSMYGGMPMMGMNLPMGMASPMGMPSPMGMMGPSGFGGFNNASTYPLQHAPPLDPKIDRWRREVEAREGSVISVPPSIMTSGGRS